MAVAFDVASNAGGDGVSSVTWSHTCTGTGTDGFIRIAAGWQDNVAISSMTYNGTAGTVIGQANNSTLKHSAMRYVLVPTTGAHNCVVTFASAVSNIVCGASSFTGVNQTTPVDGLQTGTGSGTGPSVTVTTSATGDMVIDACYNNASSAGWTAGASQTEEWDRNDSAGFAHGGGSREAGAASVTMNWTTAFGDWAHVACNINAAGAAPKSLPIFRPSLRLRTRRRFA